MTVKFSSSVRANKYYVYFLREIFFIKKFFLLKITLYTSLFKIHRDNSAGNSSFYKSGFFCTYYCTKIFIGMRVFLIYCV